MSIDRINEHSKAIPESKSSLTVSPEIDFEMIDPMTVISVISNVVGILSGLNGIKNSAEQTRILRDIERTLHSGIEALARAIFTHTRAEFDVSAVRDSVSRAGAAIMSLEGIEQIRNPDQQSGKLSIAKIAAYDACRRLLYPTRDPSQPESYAFPFIFCASALISIAQKEHELFPELTTQLKSALEFARTSMNEVFLDKFYEQVDARVTYNGDGIEVRNLPNPWGGPRPRGVSGVYYLDGEAKEAFDETEDAGFDRDLYSKRLKQEVDNQRKSLREAARPYFDGLKNADDIWRKVQEQALTLPEKKKAAPANALFFRKPVAAGGAIQAQKTNKTIRSAL